MPTEHSRRWDPLPDLPENVVREIAVQYDPGTGLAATAIYAEEAPRVSFRFGRPEAFKVYEEFSDAVYAGEQPLERMGQSGWGQPWPFHEVENSRWVARVIERNGAIADKTLRHCVIRSFDMILHVMFTDEPLVEIMP